MHDSSSSQEIEAEYIAWRAPESPAIVIRRRVMEGIHHEVNEALAAAPHGGDECGGILLGSRKADQIVVEDFEPVPSEADSEALEETLHWFRSGAQPRLSVLGFYRSHAQPDFALTEEDGELMRKHFADAEDLVLLIKPGSADTGVEDVCVRLYGRADAAFAAIPFPLTEVESPPAVQPTEVAVAQPEPAPPLLLAAPAALSWPPPRPRMLPEPEPPAKKRWVWYAALAAIGVVGGALGYQWLHPSHSAPVPSPAVTAPAAAPTEAETSKPSALNPPKPAPNASETTAEESPATAAPDTAAIRTLLDRWANALKRGDLPAATACYAPLVSTYFGRHDVTRETVRGRIKQTLAHYGGLDIYRISELKITPVSDARAVATFRKSWRTSGRHKSAGEEQERMTLVRNQGDWRISSEQQEKIYWERKPR